VRYFSGFSLKGEEGLFGEILPTSDVCVAGLSYGAVRAFEYVYDTHERVDRLILLSPAFFQTQKQSFIRVQLRYFQSNPQSYIEQFLENVAYPSDTNLTPYLHEGSLHELQSLLEYEWSVPKIQEVIARGVKIEVYLGGADKIIQSDKAFEFFSSLTLTYLIKDAGHLLR